MATYCVGNHYEVKDSVVTKYYTSTLISAGFAGTTRLAVRTGGTLSYLLGDHIGSSSVTTDANGAKTASALYREASPKHSGGDKAFGETRYTLGNLNTDYKFTGQREEASLGIYFFVARWFDPSLGRFLSPDTIVPTSTQGTQAWDRYAFVNNNPVRYNDPTGHEATDDPDGKPCDYHTDSTCPGFYEYQMSNYGWTFEGTWSNAELKLIYQVALDIIAAVGSVNVMMKMFGAVTFDRNTTCGNSCGGQADTPTVSMNPNGRWNAFSVAHELGHIWDQNSRGKLSDGLQNYTGAVYPTYAESHIGKYVIDPGSPGNGPGALGWPKIGDTSLMTKGEDFANSFAAYIYPDRASIRVGGYNPYSGFRATPRGNYIVGLIHPSTYPYSY